jgi:hypothetical protein
MMAGTGVARNGELSAGLGGRTVYGAGVSAESKKPPFSEGLVKR